MNIAELRETLPTIEVIPDIDQDAAATDKAGEREKTDHLAADRTQHRGFSFAAKAFFIAALVIVVGGVGVAAALQIGSPLHGTSKAGAPVFDKDSKGTVSSRVDGALVHYKIANRGMTIDVTGEDGVYYTGVIEGVNVLIEKKWVRLASAKQPAVWKGYSNDKVPLFKTAYLLGDPVAILPLDTEVEVQDEQDEWLFVKTSDGIQGYARKADFKNEEQKRDEDEAAASIENDSWGGGNWYYDSSEETYAEPVPEQTPAPEPAPVPTGNDGQEIELVAYKPVPRHVVETAYADESSAQSDATRKSLDKGTILSDGVPLYLAKLKRGETVALLSPTNRSGDYSATISVKVRGVQGTIARSIVRLSDDPPFRAIDVYAREGATLFSDYQMQHGIRTCSINTLLHVVDEYDTNYVIEESGIYIYVPKDSTSLSKLDEKQENDVSAQNEWSNPGYYNYYSGGNNYGEDYHAPSSDSGSTPADEPEPTPSPEQEWTDAVL